EVPGDDGSGTDIDSLRAMSLGVPSWQTLAPTGQGWPLPKRFESVVYDALDRQLIEWGGAGTSCGCIGRDFAAWQMSLPGLVDVGGWRPSSDLRLVLSPQPASGPIRVAFDLPSA